MPELRRTFAPVLVAGVASAGGVAWASNHDWFRAAAGDGPVRVGSAAFVNSATVPLGTALGLVVLASWGAVLLTRGRARRLTAAVGLLASIWLVVVVTHAAATGRHRLAVELEGLGSTGSVERTLWPWFAIAASGVSLLATVAAVLLSPVWPEMSTRYDQPSGGSEPAAGLTDPAEPSNLDLWKAIDEGHDPTEGRT